VANQFTSVATTPGIGTNTVQTAYDLALGFVLRETPMYRQWAVTKRPERPSMPGSSVVLNKYDYFGSAAVTAAKVPLNEEQDVDSTKLPPSIPISLSFNEYGFAVTKTKKIKFFSFVGADLDRYAVTAVGAHLSDTMDELVQDTLVTGTQKVLADGVGAEASLTSANTIGGDELRKAVTKLRTNKAVPKDGQFWVAGIHPHVVHDLRQETGSNGWRVPNEYGQSQDDIWRGEIGEFEGVRFVQNTRTRRTQTGSGSSQANSVYRTFIIGQEAVAEGVYEEPHTTLAPGYDKLGRFDTVGWYGCLGWSIYRDEAMVQILSGSSVATL
jgi:N4-gp56 family major capsid protein